MAKRRKPNRTKAFLLLLIAIPLFKRKDNERLISTVDIQLKKSENSWVIDSDGKFQDAILGGFPSVVQGIGEAFQ